MSAFLFWGSFTLSSSQKIPSRHCNSPILLPFGNWFSTLRFPSSNPFSDVMPRKSSKSAGPSKPPKSSRLDESEAPSTWRSALRPEDAERLRKIYEIPDGVKIRIPGLKDDIHGNTRGHEVCIFEKSLEAGLRLPFPQVVREILHTVGMAPTEFKAGAWRHVVACCVAWRMVLGDGVQLSAPEFLNIYTPFKYGHTWTFQGRGRRFFSAPSTWLSNPPFEKSFFYVSGLGWELPSILWDRPPEARVPLKWREPPSKTVFDKPKLTAIQRERLDQMIAWSIAHVEDGSEESNLGFLLRPVNLQKYLGFSVQRCAGMSKIPHPLFPSKKKKKGEVAVSTRLTRSKGPSPVPVKETELPASSDTWSASLSSAEGGDSTEHPAPQVVEGPIILGVSSEEDEDDIPLARRPPALKRKATESPRCADPPSFSNEEEARSCEYADFVRAYRSTKKAKGVQILLEGEDPEPLPGTASQVELGEAGTAPPSLLPSAPETEPALEEAKIGSVPESEATAAAVDRQEAGPIVGGDLMVADVASFEAPSPQAIHVDSVGEIETVAAEIGSVDGTEPIAVEVESVEEVEAVAAETGPVAETEPVVAEIGSVDGTGSAASVGLVEGVGAFEVPNEPEPSNLGGEVPQFHHPVGSAPGGPVWWETVGLHEDPVLGLRRQIEVYRGCR